MANQVLLAALDELRGRDRVLDGLIIEHGTPTLARPTAGSQRFAYLVRSIVYQQLAGKAAFAIHARVVAACGGAVTAEAILRTDRELLRSCGLSGSKLASIVDLAEHVDLGKLALSRAGRMSDADVIEHLVQVRGIGRWTAEMFLMFGLGRLDIWPTGDFGVRAGYAAAWGLATMPTPKELAPLGEAFAPYRSVVAWYCWRAADARKSGPS